MDIAAFARIRRIDIRMRIHPDNRNLLAQPFPHRLRSPGNSADGNGVVAAERQNQFSRFGVGVDLVADLLCYGRHESWLFHFADFGVGGGAQRGVVVDLVVVGDVEVEVLF